MQHSKWEWPRGSSVWDTFYWSHQVAFGAVLNFHLLFMTPSSFSHFQGYPLEWVSWPLSSYLIFLKTISPCPVLRTLPVCWLAEQEGSASATRAAPAFPHLHQQPLAKNNYCSKELPQIAVNDPINCSPRVLILIYTISHCSYGPSSTRHFSKVSLRDWNPTE